MSPSATSSAVASATPVSPSLAATPVRPAALTFPLSWPTHAGTVVADFGLDMAGPQPSLARDGQIQLLVAGRPRAMAGPLELALVRLQQAPPVTPPQGVVRFEVS